MRNLIKTTLTIVLLFWAIPPFLDAESGNPQVELIQGIGYFILAIIVIFFFVFVGFYCKTLQKCLENIQPRNRKVNPKSVWFMFLLPFNFIEDFFIVINLSNSIEAEAKTNPKLGLIKDNGMVTGIGWSIAQILSFIPSIVGQIAGIISFVLVIYHWVFIHKINKLLA